MPGCLPRIALAAALAALAPCAFAQLAPDAGRTLRELEKPPVELPRTPPPGIQLEEPAPAPPRPAPDVRFTLRGLRVTGNTAIASAELQPLVHEFVGREVGLSELEEAAARITRRYRERGYLLARAYLPAQEIREGAVEISVLEGRLGSVGIRNASRVRDGLAAAYLAPLEGRPFEERSFERRFLLLADLPGVGEPRAALKAGAAPGESDLAVELDARPLVTAAVEADNYGNRFTGGNRVSGQVNLASPTRSGDLLVLRATHGDPGLDYRRVSYQLPLGSDGVVLGAGHSRTDYRLGRNFSMLEASGEAQTWNGTLSYPLVRARALNLHAQLGHEKRDLEDRVGATATVTNKKTALTTLALSGDWTDATGGVTVYWLAYGRGRLMIETPVARAIDAASARTAGDYHKWNLSLLRLQPLAARLSLYFSWSAQKAGRNLDSSEKFVLGGAQGVRAYPSGEASGDSGYAATAELRYATGFAGFPGVLQPFAFVDTGRVTVNEQPFAPGENRRRLSAAGAGVGWTRAGDFSVRLVIAHKLGNARATSDTDHDARAWVQLAKHFR